MSDSKKRSASFEFSIPIPCCGCCYHDHNLRLTGDLTMVGPTTKIVIKVFEDDGCDHLATLKSASGDGCKVSLDSGDEGEEMNIEF